MEDANCPIGPADVQPLRSTYTYPRPTIALPRSNLEYGVHRKTIAASGLMLYE